MFELQTITGKSRSDVYMKRWRILGYLSADSSRGKFIESKLPFTVRIHKFFRPDTDKHKHNHPWNWAVSFVLWGCYTEERLFKNGEHKLIVHKAPAINFISGDDYHRIVYLKGNPITLFITGKKRKSWGFLENGKHIPWLVYLGIISRES